MYNFLSSSKPYIILEILAFNIEVFIGVEGSFDSIVLFLLAENLEDFEEQTDDIHVDDGGSHGIVVERESLLASSHDQLGVDDQIHAVDQTKHHCD